MPDPNAPLTGIAVQPTPVVGQAVQPPAPGGNILNQIAANPQNNMPQSQGGDIGGIYGQGNIGNVVAPINYSQQAQLFQAPNQQPIANNIQGGFNLQNQGNYANSPLAGLTTLGQVSNANAPGINTATSNALTGAQLQQINALNAQAQGQGPSPATVAAQQAAQQNIANQMALIGSQRGAGNTALGLRNAQEAGAQLSQQGVQAATLGKTQEELAAQQQLTGALGGAQGQVMQGAQAQAGLQSTANLQNAAAANQAMLQQGSMGQQVQLANQASQQGTQALNANEYNAMLQAQMAQANNQLTANENYANLVTGQNTNLEAIKSGEGIANQANQMGLIGAGIAGIAAGGAATLSSDRYLKTNIKSGTRSIKEFLSKISTPTSGMALLQVNP
mgnify:CR=1 FL=1